MKTVKNVSDQDLAIPDFGIIKAGETADVADEFNNPNFEVVKSGKPTEAKAESEEDAAPKADKSKK